MQQSDSLAVLPICHDSHEKWLVWKCLKILEPNLSKAFIQGATCCVARVWSKKMGGWFFNSYIPNIPFSKTVNRPIAALSSPCKTMSTTGQSGISASRVLHLTTGWRFNGFWSFFTAWVSPQLFYVCVGLLRSEDPESDGWKWWFQIIGFTYCSLLVFVSPGTRITESQWVKLLFCLNCSFRKELASWWAPRFAQGAAVPSKRLHENSSKHSRPTSNQVFLEAFKVFS